MVVSALMSLGSLDPWAEFGMFFFFFFNDLVRSDILRLLLLPCWKWDIFQVIQYAGILIELIHYLYLCSQTALILFLGIGL